MGGEACQPGCACVPERKGRRERQKEVERNRENKVLVRI